MNEWTATIWASISAMMAALVLTLIVVLGSLARESAQIMHTEDNAVAMVKEFRKYLHYDDQTPLLAQDVISAIGESRGFPVIRVDTDHTAGQNYTWVWNTSTPKDEFSTQSLTEKFDGVPLDTRFYGKLVYDLNGSVVGIDFRRN
jgi:hypothetical protein